MLSKDGLVDLMPYKKASVAAGTDADYKTAFDLRLMLEPYALLQSIDKIPASEIRAMELMLDRDCQQVVNVPDFYASDNIFHQMLYQYTDSKLLTSTLDHIRTYTMRYFTRRFDMIVEAKRLHYMDNSYDQIRTLQLRQQRLGGQISEGVGLRVPEGRTDHRLKAHVPQNGNGGLCGLHSGVPVRIRTENDFFRFHYTVPSPCSFRV